MAAKILAIETALNKCSVAISIDGELKFVQEHAFERAHAEQLAPMISSALAACDLKASDLTAVAVSSGPGSYTGLRIGVSTAKGICYPTGASLVAVSTLQALALQAAFANGEIRDAAFHDATKLATLDPTRQKDAKAVERHSGHRMIAVAMRARAKELYWAVYRLPEEKQPPASDFQVSLARDERRQVAPELEVVVHTKVTDESAAVKDLCAARRDSRILLCGNAADFLNHHLPSNPTAVDCGLISRIQVVPPTPLPLAASVAILGAGHCLRRNFEDVASFEPAYLKEFVAGKRKGSIFDQLQF